MNLCLWIFFPQLQTLIYFPLSCSTLCCWFKWKINTKFIKKKRWTCRGESLFAPAHPDTFWTVVTNCIPPPIVHMRVCVCVCVCVCVYSRPACTHTCSKSNIHRSWCEVGRAAALSLPSLFVSVLLWLCDWEQPVGRSRQGSAGHTNTELDNYFYKEECVCVCVWVLSGLKQPAVKPWT